MLKTERVDDQFLVCKATISLLLDKRGILLQIDEFSVRFHVHTSCPPGLMS